MMAAQLGLAMIPLCSRTLPGLISGTTRGTPASMRNAEELSTTTAPLLTATGAKRLDVELPAENSPILTPLNASSVSSRTASGLPLNGSVLPAERADANNRNSDIGKLRRSRQPNSSIPTAPVAPTMATTGAAERPDCIVFSQFTKKDPRNDEAPLVAGRGLLDASLLPLVRSARARLRKPTGLLERNRALGDRNLHEATLPYCAWPVKQLVPGSVRTGSCGGNVGILRRRGSRRP